MAGQSHALSLITSRRRLWLFILPWRGNRKWKYHLREANGKALGTACATFAVTNIDNIFVLVTFFAESSTSETLTPLRITIGQYIGFTAITVVSLIGFGASFLFPVEPIGFLGLLPILLGVWWFFGVVLPSKKKKEGEEEAENNNDDSAAAGDGAARHPTVGMFTAASMKAIFNVASITVINGADNISTYIPLFSQVKGAEIAVYVLTYYVLLGAWCLAAFLVMKQRHILALAQKYARIVVPFLYLGLGIFIIVESECYPWSIRRIDDSFLADPGTFVMAIVTAFTLLPIIGAMVWIKLLKRKAGRQAATAPAADAEGLMMGTLEAGGEQSALDNERSKAVRSPEPPAGMTTDQAPATPTPKAGTNNDDLANPQQAGSTEGAAETSGNR